MSIPQKIYHICSRQDKPIAIKIELSSLVYSMLKIGVENKSEIWDVWISTSHHFSEEIKKLQTK